MKTTEATQPGYRARQVRAATVSLQGAQVDDTERMVRNVSVSSEEPYERYYGTEILSHEAGAIDLSRITTGATPLLFNHDRDAFLGKVSNPQLKDGKLYVDLKFSTNEAGAQALADVKDGILTECSIGYEINRMEVDEDEETYTATRWTLYECSLVTVPADYTVGVGRNNTEVTLVRQKHMKPETTTTTEQEQHPVNGRSATQERERINAIRFIASRPNFKRFVSENDVQQAIDENWSKKVFNEFVLQQMGEVSPQVFAPTDDPRGNGSRGGRDAAAQIVTNREFQRFREGGRKMVSFEIPGVRSAREIIGRSITTTANAGATVQTLPSVQGVAYEHLVVADLLAQGSMDTASIVYPRENSFVSGAEPVPEVNLKPEQTIDLVPDAANAKKIAAWTKISDEMFEDSPAAADYIRTRLGFAVLKAEDKSILNGSGIGADMRGIRSTPGLQTQALGSDIIPDAIRKGIRNVEETTDFMVTGIVVNVHDWATIEMLKDAYGRYLVGVVTMQDEFGTPRIAPALWSRPVAVSKSLPQGVALVGAFSTAAQLFRRKGLVIELTNSNEDDFKRNLVMLRAELRAALAVYAGSAFCEVTGIPA